MIIDIHNHIGLSTDGAHGKMEVFLPNLAKYHIAKAVIFATDEADVGQTYERLNDKILGLAQEHKGKILPFARLIPSAGPIAVDELRRCLDKGVLGLKLKAADGFKAQEASPLLDVIKDREKFPVILHTAHERESQPAAWKPLFEAYPRVKFVFAHGGKDCYRQCADILVEYDNVFADTTTLSYNRTRHIYEQAGASKILFGSDYPYSHPAIELAKFKVLINKSEDLEKIHYKNALSILEL